MTFSILFTIYKLYIYISQKGNEKRLPKEIKSFTLYFFFLLFLRFLIFSFYFSFSLFCVCVCVCQHARVRAFLSFIFFSFSFKSTNTINVLTIPSNSSQNYSRFSRVKAFPSIIPTKVEVVSRKVSN